MSTDPNTVPNTLFLTASQFFESDGKIRSVAYDHLHDHNPLFARVSLQNRSSRSPERRAGVELRRAASAKTAAGGIGTGPNVTVTDNGDDTVTMANGIASIVIVKKTGRLNSPDVHLGP